MTGESLAWTGLVISISEVVIPFAALYGVVARVDNVVSSVEVKAFMKGISSTRCMLFISGGDEDDGIGTVDFSEDMVVVQGQERLLTLVLYLLIQSICM